METSTKILYAPAFHPSNLPPKTRVMLHQVKRALKFLSNGIGSQVEFATAKRRNPVSGSRQIKAAVPGLDHTIRLAGR